MCRSERRSGAGNSQAESLCGSGWDPAEWSEYSRGEKPVDWGEQQPPVGRAGGLTRVGVEDGPGKMAGCCRSVADKERISFCSLSLHSFSLIFWSFQRQKQKQRPTNVDHKILQAVSVTQKYHTFIDAALWSLHEDVFRTCAVNLQRIHSVEMCCELYQNGEVPAGRRAASSLPPTRRLSSGSG